MSRSGFFENKNIDKKSSSIDYILKHLEGRIYTTFSMSTNPASLDHANKCTIFQEDGVEARSKTKTPAEFCEMMSKSYVLYSENPKFKQWLLVVEIANDLNSWDVEHIKDFESFFATFDNAPTQLVLDFTLISKCEPERLKTFCTAIQKANIIECLIAQQSDNYSPNMAAYITAKEQLYIIQELLPKTKLKTASYPTDYYADHGLADRLSYTSPGKELVLEKRIHTQQNTTHTESMDSEQKPTCKLS